MKTAAAALAGLLLLASPAAAQLPVDPGQPPGAPAEAAPAEMSVGIATGLSERGRRYVIAGDRLLVRGTLRPFVAGETVTVELLRGRRRVSRRTVEVKDDGGTGRFEVKFKARRSGRYTVRAAHSASDRQQEAKASARFQALTGRAGRGSGGVRVRLLQRGLRRLGYVTSTGGRFDGATSRAVLAFRKVNRMSRTGHASRAIFSRVFRGIGRFRLEYPRAGKHVEADISRQVLVLASRGRAERVYHMSSGKASTPTVLGRFRFYRKQPGTNSLGMVHSNYFIRGYAIHGYPSVPTHPASHGCLRIPIPNARFVYNWIRLGDRIFVYR
jgi:hypothetical protein